MSMNIFVYGDNFKDVSKEGCEKYLLQFDLKAEMHPEVHIETAGGFLPFRIEFLSIDSLKGKLFLSGFEVYHDTYDYIQDQKNIRETSTPPVKKRGGIMGLFKKAKGTTESVQNFIKSPEFMESSEIESVLKKCSYITDLNFVHMDELIMALAFASYLAETCNGVVYEPQTGECFCKNIRQELYMQARNAFDELDVDALHPFDEWR